LKESAVEEEVIRHEIIAQYVDIKIEYMRRNINELVDEYITSDERNPWFSENDIDPKHTFIFSSLHDSLSYGIRNSNDKR
jgi:hypothetical protein